MTRWGVAVVVPLLAAACAVPCPPGTQPRGDYCAPLDGAVPDASRDASRDAAACVCPAGLVCSDAGCVECTSNEDCDRGRCADGVCVECGADADCPDALRPRCEAGACASCLAPDGAMGCPLPLVARELRARLCEARLIAPPRVDEPFEDADLASFCHPAGERAVWLRDLVERERARAHWPAADCPPEDPACWLDGLGPAGASCFDDVACASGCARDAPACGACAREVGSGGSCNSRDRVCVPDLRCVGGACGPALGEGVVCSTDAQCEDGLYCVETPTFECVAQLGAGASCDVSRANPDAQCCCGDVCRDDTGQCGPLPGSGEPCHRDRRCADGLRCHMGTCRAPRAEGALCAATGECAFDARCDDDNRCRTMARPGEACDALAPCLFGYGCAEGRCAALPDAGEPCTAELGCLRGVCSGAECRDQAVGSSCEAPSETYDELTGDEWNGPRGYDALDPCGAGSSCRGGSCVRDGAEGESCAGVERCAPPLECPGATCVPVPDGCP